jgi:lipoprotein-releasing system ATP-binding protein
MNNVLQAVNLGKTYPLPKGELTIFSDLNFSLKRGELVAVMGVSGVGKTTLLNLFGALDRPSTGRILIDEEDLSQLADTEISRLRNRKIGFVFQFYHLLPEFTAVENIMFPLLIRGEGKKQAHEMALSFLRDVGLSDKAPMRPSQLSGGEQQRIAIARALINEPVLLLADEPTGNLDWKTGRGILDLIRRLHERKTLSSVIVTHNENVARFCDKSYIMEEGGLKLFQPS